MDRIIGVITGLATVCLALSIFASHFQEWIASFMSKRSVELEDSIRQMLVDPDLTRAFFQHPLIVSLAKARPQKTKSGSAAKICLPTYIPPDIFRKVLQNLLTQQFAPKATIFTDVLGAIPDMALAKTLGAVTLGAKDEQAIAASIESWYNNTMDRLSGLYKRKTQLSLFVIGLVMAVVLNANLIHVTTVLWNTPAARDKANVVALQYANDPGCAKTATTSGQCGALKLERPAGSADHTAGGLVAAGERCVETARLEACAEAPGCDDVDFSARVAGDGLCGVAGFAILVRRAEPVSSTFA